MVRAFLSVVALTLALSAALAQNPREQLYAKLALTKPQLARAEALQKKYVDRAYAKLATLRTKYGETPTPAQEKQIVQEMTTFRAQVQKDASKELRALLTPAQRKKLDLLEAPATLRVRPGN
jgi:hypothetical protein